MKRFIVWLTLGIMVLSFLIDPGASLALTSGWANSVKVTIDHTKINAFVLFYKLSSLVHALILAHACEGY